jgi:cell division protein FtsL
MKLRDPYHRYSLFINLWILVLVIASALILVRTQYESRRLFVQLEKAENGHKQLMAEQAQTQAKQRQMASPAKIEKSAAQSLDMKAADPTVTLYLGAKQ